MKLKKEKYKPGQVAATLFSSKQNASKAVSNNNPLARLFSTKKSRGAEVIGGKTLGSSNSTIKTSEGSVQSKQVEPQHASPTKTSKSPKVKKKKLRVESDNEGSHNLMPNNLSQSDAKNFITVTSLEGKENATSGVKSSPAKKRKLEDNKNEEEGTAKRPRRDRQREKTADKRTIFVGNCPLSADKKTLKKLFKTYGQIETVRFRCAPPADPSLPKRAIVIMKNFHEQCNNYVAYIVFKEEEAATKALEKNGFLLDSLHLRVDIAASSKKHDKKRSIFVGNLPFTVNEEDIRRHFEDCGDIMNVRIVRDRQSSLGKGICYVQFQSKDAVSLALKLNGSQFQGRPMRVMICVNKPKKKDKDPNPGKNNKSKIKTGSKKPSFAPSNRTSAAFKNILKTKKEKRLRKMKKKKEVAKKSDGLSSIFGDVPSGTKSVEVKKTKPGEKGKLLSGNKQSKDLKGKKNFRQKGSAFKGKGSAFKGKGIAFKGKGSAFKGKGSAFKGKGSAFKGKGSAFKSKAKPKGGKR